MNQATELIAQQYANGAANKKVWSDILYNVKAYGAKGDGVTDDTTAIQAAISSVTSNGGIVYFPAGTYRITSPINLINSKLDNSKTLYLQGESQLNTIILLDNDSAEAAFIYDSGSKTFDVTGCSVTSGSNKITTTGNFIAAGVEAGMTFSCNGVPRGAVVSSVDSSTQITINTNANATKSAFTTRFYKNVTNNNRIVLKDFFIKNSKATVAFTSWHSGTGIKLKGSPNSIFENIRIQGFTQGLYTLSGWFNQFNNVYTSACRNGIILEGATFANELRNITTTNSGENSGGCGVTVRDSGSVTFINLAHEIEIRGLLLEGVRGCSIVGGNIESISFTHAIEIKGLSIISPENEAYWSNGISIQGIHFWDTLGIVFANGCRGIKIHGNSFIESFAPPFTVNSGSCINASGDPAYIKEVDYGSNRYYANGAPTLHILSGTNDYPQSFTENWRRYASAIPFYGKNWKVGDRVDRLPSSILVGINEAWICSVASDGVNDGSAAWVTVGQVGYRTNAGSPVGLVPPRFVGEELLNSTGGVWFKAKGPVDTDWVALN